MQKVTKKKKYIFSEVVFFLKLEMIYKKPIEDLNFKLLYSKKNLILLKNFDEKSES